MNYINNIDCSKTIWTSNLWAIYNYAMCDASNHKVSQLEDWISYLNSPIYNLDTPVLYNILYIYSRLFESYKNPLFVSFLIRSNSVSSCLINGFYLSVSWVSVLVYIYIFLFNFLISTHMFQNRLYVGPVNKVNHISWVDVVTPTDRPKSVRKPLCNRTFLWRCLCCHFALLTFLLV